MINEPLNYKNKYTINCVYSKFKGDPAMLSFIDFPAMQINPRKIKIIVNAGFKYSLPGSSTINESTII
tara:strand:- start:4609 stop:4812 length:204 start_codon:yes stop_codon:yes gene_type:complete